MKNISTYWNQIGLSEMKIITSVKLSKRLLRNGDLIWN